MRFVKKQSDHDLQYLSWEWLYEIHHLYKEDALVFLLKIRDNEPYKCIRENVYFDLI